MRGLRILTLALIGLWAMGVSAQSLLLPTPISTAPYFFYGTTGYPSFQQPYVLPDYWQQQQPNLMTSLMPALEQFSSMLEDDLMGPQDSYSRYFEDEYPSRGRSYNADDYTYNRDRAKRRSSSVSRSVASTSETTKSEPKTASDTCTDCETNQGSQPKVLTAEASDSVNKAAKISELVLDDSLKAYQESEQVKKMISAIKRDATLLRNSRRVTVGSKSADESVGRCLMYIKFAMKEAGYFSGYPSGQYAANFSPALEARGFTNLMKTEGYNITDPDKAPVGSILVYENVGGAKTPGHIEVKLGANSYGSDFIDDQPLSKKTNQRRLIGIYAKLPQGGS